MGTEQIIFYVFAAIMVFGASMVITVRNPVRAALFLVLTFFSSAAIWILLEAEFLANCGFPGCEGGDEGLR